MDSKHTSVEAPTEITETRTAKRKGRGPKAQPKEIKEWKRLFRDGWTIKEIVAALKVARKLV
jgi:hypothetical protein